MKYKIVHSIVIFSLSLPICPINHAQAWQDAQEAKQKYQAAWSLIDSQNISAQAEQTFQNANNLWEQAEIAWSGKPPVPPQPSPSPTPPPTPTGQYPFSNKKPVFPVWTGAYNPALPENKTQGPYRTATARWGKYQNTYPKPTNRWYVTSTFMPEGNQYPICAYPLLLNVTNNSLQICCPATPTINPNPNTPLPPNQDQTPNMIVGFTNDLEFYATELEQSTIQPAQYGSIISPVLNRPLSVTYQWGTAQKGFSSPIVRGMPYATFIVNNVTPAFKTINAILSVNGQGVSAAASPRVTSDTFAFTFNNGQTWYLLASKQITLTCSLQGVQATAPFSGTIRFTEQQIFPQDTQGATIKQYASCYPTSGSVDFNVATNNVSTVTFTWETSGSGDLLMMSLPHHQHFLKNPLLSSATFTSVRGKMVGVTGATWTMQIPLQTGAAPFPWNSPTPIDQTKIAAIKKALLVGVNPPTLGPDMNFIPGSADDSYGFGKEIAKLARIALIADQLNESTALATAIQNMQKAFLPWIKGTGPDPLYYDVNPSTQANGAGSWGGVCTKNGLTDSSADYGMGWYNDHHFHFGYFIYAAAVFIKLAENVPAYQEFISGELTPFIYDLIRDIANPVADTYFPDYRMFDWYLGHSLAAGLFPFASGRNQESTSEAHNAWYGIYLFGLATNNSAIQNLGRTLLACEIHSAQTYWFLVPTTPAYSQLPNYGVYPSSLLYAKNQTNPCVGVLWEMMADFQTFFADGANTHPIEYINLIHFLPFTPATEFAIPKLWNTFQYGTAPSADYNGAPGKARTLVNALSNADGNPTIAAFRRSYPAIWQSWKGLIYMSQAISDPASAWTNAQTLTAYDSGNSPTNTLYWIATRPKS